MPNEESKEKRVAMFVGYGWLSVSPSLVSAIRLLTEQGYWVDVIHIYSSEFEVYSPKLDKLHIELVAPYKNNRLNILFKVFRLLFCSFKFTRKQKYNFFIGVDLEGIIVAGILSRILKTPYIYYSLEIFSKEDIAEEKGVNRLVHKVQKFFEVFYSRSASYTIIQNEMRADFLVKDNGIEKSKIFIVPNSYYFVEQKNGDCIDSIIKIPDNKTIVIYAGSVQPEMAIDEIVTYLDLWAEDTVLLIHTPYITEHLEDIKKLISQKNLQEKVIFSSKKLSFEALAALVRKAHIGISFYKQVDNNHKLCPSGKVSFYLSQNLPVIVNNIPSSESIINSWNCGVCVDTGKAVGGAIQEILDSYDAFSAKAKTCYEQEFEFSKYFNHALESIEKL